MFGLFNKQKEIIGEIGYVEDNFRKTR